MCSSTFTVEDKSVAVTPSERKGDELVTLPPDWRRSVRSGKTKDYIEFRGPGGKGVATTVAQAWREFNGDVALMPQPRTQPTLTPPVYLTGPQKARSMKGGIQMALSCYRRLETAYFEA